MDLLVVQPTQVVELVVEDQDQKVVLAVKEL